MPNRRETTITNELVNILRNMRHRWELETEVNVFIKGNSALEMKHYAFGRISRTFLPKIHLNCTLI